MDFLEVYWTDVYKTGHQPMLPPGSQLMFSNFTPRSGRLANIPNSKGVIAIGNQMMLMKMKHDWDVNFFKRDVSEIDQFGQDMTDMLMLGEDNPYNTDHIKALHELQYLPLEFRAITEGTHLPYKVPMFTVHNTKPLSKTVVDWIVNYLETIMSAESWQAPTSATTALAFKEHGMKGIKLTDPENMWFLDYKYHDFSMRGMGGKSAILNSGIGFAAVSRGSDTLPVIPGARKYYGAKKACINSVIATEHAIMCAVTGFYKIKNDGSWEKIGELEIETFRYLLKKFPKGILSIVSDTWDLWRVICDYCVELKDEILARDGKVVFRPDSGNPVDIMCGKVDYTLAYMEGVTTEQYWADTDPSAIKPEDKGVIELLWDIFGGDTSSTGYKRLNPKVGAIYGDSITFQRSVDIDARMIAKGFATTNYVLGVGSYSLQYCTRDTHGFAQKATAVEVEDHLIEIFKDPITDSGDKKSAKGLLAVHKNSEGEYVLRDQVTWDEVNSEKNELKLVFRDGEFFNQTTYDEIRERIDKQLGIEREKVAA